MKNEENLNASYLPFSGPQYLGSNFDWTLPKIHFQHED